MTDDERMLRRWTRQERLRCVLVEHGYIVEMQPANTVEHYDEHGNVIDLELLHLDELGDARPSAGDDGEP